MFSLQNVFLTNVATQAQFFPQKISFVSLAPPFYFFYFFIFFWGLLLGCQNLSGKKKQKKQTNKPCGKTAEL
jgi:hypothetical protein